MFDAKLNVVMKMTVDLDRKTENLVNLISENGRSQHPAISNTRKSVNLEDISLLSAKDIMENFIKGINVFKITAIPKIQNVLNDTTIISCEDTFSGSPKLSNEMRDVHMVFEYRDFFKKLTNHPYHPLLSMSPIYIQIFYLYGCMNIKKGEKRNEIFILWWRKTGTDAWIRWIEFHPYDDSDIIPPEHNEALM